MAEETGMVKKTFIGYFDWGDYTDDMTNEEAGILFKKILAFHNDPPDPGGGVKFVWKRIKNQMKEDFDKRVEEIEKRREAGRKGGLQRAKNSKGKVEIQGVLSSAKQSQANQADTDTVNDNDTDNEYVNVKKEIKKENLEKLYKEFGKRNIDDVIEDMQFYLEEKGKYYKNYYLAIRKWLRKAGVKPLPSTKKISPTPKTDHFFTSLNQKLADDNTTG